MEALSGNLIGDVLTAYVEHDALSAVFAVVIPPSGNLNEGATLPFGRVRPGTGGSITLTLWAGPEGDGHRDEYVMEMPVWGLEGRSGSRFRFEYPDSWYFI
jgi:hypothetical protein